MLKKMRVLTEGLILLAAGVLTLSRAQDEPFKSELLCGATSTGYVDLTCPESSLIKVERIAYAVAEAQQACRLLPTECHYMEQGRGHAYGCNGKPNCRINTAKKYFNRTIYRCGGWRVTHAYVSYSCISKSEVTDMCSPTASRRQPAGASRGFLSTPEYPKPYSANLNCSYFIVGKHIVLYAISIALTSSADCLTTRDLLQGQSWCGGKESTDVIENSRLTSSQSGDFLKIVLSSGKDESTVGGILLYYTVVPYELEINPESVMAASTSSVQSINQGGCRNQTPFAQPTESVTDRDGTRALHHHYRVKETTIPVVAEGGGIGDNNARDEDAANEPSADHFIGGDTQSMNPSEATQTSATPQDLRELHRKELKELREIFILNKITAVDNSPQESNLGGPTSSSNNEESQERHLRPQQCSIIEPQQQLTWMSKHMSNDLATKQ